MPKISPVSQIVLCSLSLLAFYAAGLSPRLAKRPEFQVEGPSSPLLVGDVPDSLDNGGGGDEKVIGSVRPPLARPLQVDDRVDQHVGDVYPLWTKLAGQRFRETPLRRLGRCKTRGVAGGNHGTCSCRNHRRRQPAGQIEQRHRINLKVAVQHLRIGFQKVPERTPHRIMNQHFWCTELGTYHLKSGVELRFIGNIAWIGARKCELSLQRDEPLVSTSEHGNCVPTA